MYEAEISRSNPTTFLFLIDQSASMEDLIPSTEKSKADQVADVLNRTLATLIIRCTKSEGTRDYFNVGVIAYSQDKAYNAFRGDLESSILHSISEIEKSPLRVEDRVKKMDDGAGGLVETQIKFPIWFEPTASGGTPMCQGLITAAEVLASWCDQHMDGFPPTILHITDGESTDGDPEEIANKVKELRTNDGHVLLFNLHVSAASVTPITFPASETDLPDAYAKLLFRMSSNLPGHLIDYARNKGYEAIRESKGYMFNADPVSIVDFFDIGTRAIQLR